MKIRTKLTLGFVGIALLAGFIGIIAIFQNNNTKRIAEEEVYRSISHLNDVWGLMEAQEHQEIAVKDFLFVQRGLKEKRADYFHEKERWTKIYQKYYTETCEHVKPLVKKYYESMEKYNAAVEEAFELYGQGADLETLHKKAGEADKYAEIGHENSLTIIEHVHKAHIEPAKENIAKGINKTTTITIITSIVAVFAAIGLGLFISRSISNPLCALQKKSEMIGKGNLDVRAEVKSKDEIGELAASFNKMAEDLSRTTASMDELNEEIDERKQIEEVLTGRVKELDCLYGFSKLTKRMDITRDKMLQGLVKLIPAGWQYPAITCARIIFNGQEFTTDIFAVTKWKQSADIILYNEKVGTIEVYYSEQKPEVGEGPFLKEERRLIDNIAHTLSEAVEHDETEQKLRQIQTAMENATDAMAITDGEGHIIYINAAFGNLFKFSFEDTETIDFDSIFINPTIGANAYRESLNGGFWTGETEMVSSNGQVFPAYLRSTSITDENLNNLGVLFVINDITELKEAEKRQAKLLEQVESVNDELKSFAYIISHDLKAPLRGISSLANWLSDDYRDALGNDGKQQMDLLKSRVGRMQDLIDGVLQYSRVGRVKEDIVDIELNQVIPEVIDLLAAPKNISITVDDDLPVIPAEKTRISQLFQNMLSNSIKYMDKPEGQIHIGCVEDGDNWRFSISDNGPGIEEKHFEKIFQIFQTVS
ncbi:MAG: HAMP domain-containing protein, partial [Planctomycetes bacterium]|nr:HAMP domain-containing protein [Planctomycetota bacterium]